MTVNILTRLKLLAEKFGESWTACALAMTQGDLTVFTVSHASTAAQVGIVTGMAYVITSFIRRINNRWGNAAMTGFLTATADYVVHPGMWMFSAGDFMLPTWSESIGTGLGASALAIVFIYVMEKRKQAQR